MINPIPYKSVVPAPRRVRLIDEVPEELMVEWGVKLYTLMNLAWNYIDTILDIVCQRRICATKTLVRTIRRLRREYDIFRAKSVDSEFIRKEDGNSDRFEELLQGDFSRLFNGLEMEISHLGLSEEDRVLVIAIQQALTIMDAVKMYARWCDARIRDLGIWTCDCCMVQSEFLALYPLIPQFAGDALEKSETRRITASILCNSITEARINVNL